MTKPVIVVPSRTREQWRQWRLADTARRRSEREALSQSWLNSLTEACCCLQELEGLKPRVKTARQKLQNALVACGVDVRCFVPMEGSADGRIALALMALDRNSSGHHALRAGQMDRLMKWELALRLRLRGFVR
jgi:hypothetical protein